MNTQRNTRIGQLASRTGVTFVVALATAMVQAGTYRPSDDPTLASFNQANEPPGSTVYYETSEINWADDPTLASFNEWIRYADEHPSGQVASTRGCDNPADSPTLASFEGYVKGMC